MNNYSDYTVEDFASDLDFIRWVKNPSQVDETSDLQRWIKQHPEKATIIEEAQELVSQAVKLDADLLKAQSDLWNRIDNTITKGQDDSATSDKKEGFSLIRVAATISILLIAGIIYFTVIRAEKDSGKVAVESTNQEAVENRETTPQTVFLADGSSVILFENTTLTISPTYNEQERRVEVKGKAFFEVKRDANRPFIVQTENITTRVLGTSFLVTAYDQAPATVSVNTGKVTVFSNEVGDVEESNVQLERNEQVSYDRADELLIKSVNSKTDVEIEMNEDFVFSNRPLTEVFDLIESRYGVELLYDSETVKNCLINASLVGIPLDQKLRLIGKVSNLEFAKTTAGIEVMGAGCSVSQ